MTVNPHPSHSAPSLESRSFDFFMISSLSLIYQKAKNVENGLIHFSQFDFEVQGKDKKGLLCTLSKLAILSTSTIQSSNLEFQQVDND